MSQAPMAILNHDYYVSISIYKIYHVVISIAIYQTSCGHFTKRRDASGLCWMDQNTLVVQYFYYLDGLWIYTLNNDSTSCKGEMIDNDFAAHDMSCSQDGKVYVTQRTKAKTMIRIYTIHNRTKEVWKTDEIRIEPNRAVNIDVNNDFIVVNYGNIVYVYNKDMLLLYNITLNLAGSLGETYLTDTDKLWGAFYKQHAGSLDISDEVIVIDLHTQEYNISKGYADNRGGTVNGVSGLKPDIVFMSTYGKEVRMYSDTGVFKERIQIEPTVGGGTLPSLATIRTREGNVLIAFGSDLVEVPVYLFNL